ncbi:efflux RND transporter periplasmic adaptor subunit [Pseudonocardia sp. CA-107938]|uniref:efflux RND transporter periplasmic adaptor subunit n=1 Tax=Pseudonocardia sp. CA-107938 TaxID=3240021 RepID=UPI003D8F53A2
MSTMVPGPPRVGRPPSRWTRIRSSPHRNRWLNAGLALLLVATAVAAYLLIGTPSAPQQVERTAVVTRGSVTASVNGSGNAASQASTPVSFTSTGVVREVDVKAGDTVALGQVLATIDPDTAQASLRTAQAQLAGAKAALAQAQSGATPVQAQKDALAITAAQQALDTAEKQLDQAHQQKDLDDKSTADAVAAAQRKLRIDEQAPCPTTTSAAGTDANQSSSGILSSQKQTSSDASSCNSKDATLAADRAAVTTAQNNQRNTELADEKAITSAEAAVTTAKNNVSSAQLAQQADQHPQTPAQIAQVQATVDAAQVAVDTATRGVDDTTLKAPQAGVVLAVNGKVGESSGASTSSSTGTTSSTSGTGSSSAASSAASSASSAGSGFVVIANLSQLAITANIAEADASKIKLGQPAQITFPGTGTTATGSVVQITPQSTVTNNVVLYPITVAVDSVPAGVGVGATANLSIRTSAKDSVLRVPTAAVTTQGDRHTVTVRRDGTDVVVPVQLGVQGDTDSEVLSGVAEGDTVVLPSATGPASNGVPGAQLRVGG